MVKKSRNAYNSRGCGRSEVGSSWQGSRSMFRLRTGLSAVEPLVQTLKLDCASTRRPQRHLSGSLSVSRMTIWSVTGTLSPLSIIALPAAWRDTNLTNPIWLSVVLEACNLQYSRRAPKRCSVLQIERHTTILNKDYDFLLLVLN